MTILAIDDEPVMLAHLETELRKVFPKADIVTFDECDEVLAFLETPQSRSLHYAFMDIKLRGMLGIELAKRIKDQCPQTRILFCTAYSYYALEAYQLHALGYLMKPVDADKLREAVSQIEAQLGTFPEDAQRPPANWWCIPSAILRCCTTAHRWCLSGKRPRSCWRCSSTGRGFR